MCAVQISFWRGSRFNFQIMVAISMYTFWKMTHVQDSDLLHNENSNTMQLSFVQQLLKNQISHIWDGTHLEMSPLPWWNETHCCSFQAQRNYGGYIQKVAFVVWAHPKLGAALLTSYSLGDRCASPLCILQPSHTVCTDPAPQVRILLCSWRLLHSHKLGHCINASGKTWQQR